MFSMIASKLQDKKIRKKAKSKVVHFLEEQNDTNFFPSSKTVGEDTKMVR